MGSPDASPSSNSASNRASASRSCASRNRLRKYSLTSPYPLLATWASTNCMRDSGNEIVTVVMAGPCLVFAANLALFTCNDNRKETQSAAGGVFAPCSSYPHVVFGGYLDDKL